MIPGPLLEVVIWIEAALLVIITGVYLLHGYLNSRYRRRVKPKVDDLRNATMRVLISPEGIHELIEELEGAPRRLQVRVFLSLAPSLAGRQRNALVGMANEIGLVSYAAHICRSPRWHERLAGARLITALGSDAQIMLSLLDDPHPLVRATAAEWAGEHPTEDLVEALLMMLTDRAPICRHSARESLLEIGAQTITCMAAHLAERDSEDITEEEVQVLVGLASPRLLAPVLRLADHESPRIRALACRALGAIGAEDGIEVLIDKLEDSDEDTRSQAARALGLLGHWPAGPRVGHLLTDSSFAVRRHAAIALKTMGAPGEILLRRLTHSDDRYAAAMAKHVLDTPGAVPAGRLLT